LSDKKRVRNYCQTIKGGRPRIYAAGTSVRVTFRLRRGVHDEILEILERLPERARSAWVINALRCYVRGEIRDVQREARDLSLELQMDLFSMFEEEE